MAALALTSSTVTTALVRQLTPAAPAPLRTAATTTRASTVVPVTVLGCAAVHLATQVISARQLLNRCHYLHCTLVIFTRNREIITINQLDVACRHYII